MPEMFRWGHICRNKNYSRSEGSFTLIELLITVALFAVVSIAIYATFNSGITVWRRAKELNIDRHREYLKIERFKRELRQMFKFAQVGFLGEKEKIYFPQIIDSEIMRVTYFFDKSKKTLFRSQDKFADILELEEGEELDSEELIYLKGAEEAEFLYAYYDPVNQAMAWVEEWEWDALPLAVKINITSLINKYETTVIIPLAQSG